MRIKLGIDIGGTEIKGGAVVAESLIFKASEKTNASQGFQAIINSLDIIIKKLIKEFPAIKEIGVASAGNIDSQNGVVIYATENLPGYTGFNIAEHFKKYGLKAICDNDAYAALFAEAKLLKLQNAAMITLGTGVGGALIRNGEIVRGKNFDEARFGHIILHPNGRLCTCGNYGCAEQYVSGSALTKSMIEAGVNITHGKEAMELIKSGDNTAKRVLTEYLIQLTELIKTIYYVYNENTIIIGGGLINSKECFFAELQELCGSEINLIPARLGNDAGIIGAALFSSRRKTALR